MGVFEITLIVACVLIVGGVAIKSVINKKHGKCAFGCDECDCSYCKHKKSK